MGTLRLVHDSYHGPNAGVRVLKSLGRQDSDWRSQGSGCLPDTLEDNITIWRCAVSKPPEYLQFRTTCPRSRFLIYKIVF